MPVSVAAASTMMSSQFTTRPCFRAVEKSRHPTHEAVALRDNESIDRAIMTLSGFPVDEPRLWRMLSPVKSLEIDLQAREGSNNLDEVHSIIVSHRSITKRKRKPAGKKVRLRVCMGGTWHRS